MIKEFVNKLIPVS